MTRPFSLTTQAHRLDLHRLWLILLAGSIGMALAWAGWAASDTLVVYETSDRVELAPQGNERATGSTQRGFEARFPKTARERLAPGRSALVFVQGKDGERAIPATISDVRDDPDQTQIRVILRADVREDAQGTRERPVPKRVKVSVGAHTPLELWLPELAPAREAPPQSASPIRR